MSAQPVESFFLCGRLYHTPPGLFPADAIDAIETEYALGERLLQLAMKERERSTITNTSDIAIATQLLTLPLAAATIDHYLTLTATTIERLRGIGAVAAEPDQREALERIAAGTVIAFTNQRREIISEFARTKRDYRQLVRASETL